MSSAGRSRGSRAAATTACWSCWSPTAASAGGPSDSSSWPGCRRRGAGRASPCTESKLSEQKPPPLNAGRQVGGRLSLADCRDGVGQDLLVGLSDVAALDGAVGPDEDRDRVGGDAVDAADLAIRVEHHGGAQAELLHKGARAIRVIAFVDKHDFERRVTAG